MQNPNQKPAENPSVIEIHLGPLDESRWDPSLSDEPTVNDGTPIYLVDDEISSFEEGEPTIPERPALFDNLAILSVNIDQTIAGIDALVELNDLVEAQQRDIAADVDDEGDVEGMHHPRTLIETTSRLALIQNFLGASGFSIVEVAAPC